MNYKEQPLLSAYAGLATQHHFKGKWVVVNNFFYENIGSDYDKLNYILTLTHNLNNPRWSIFGEYQLIKNDIYSDQLFKFGVANLISRNSQVDLNFGGSFKTTPSYTYIDIGFSKRFDWHKDISEIEKEAIKEFKDQLKGSKKQQKVEKKNNKKSSKKTNPKKLAKQEKRNSKKGINRSLRQNKKQLKKDQKALKKMNSKK